MRNYGTLARLYIDAPLVENACVDLTQAQVHFLGTVMRKSEGESVRVFNGGDGEYLANISHLSKRKATLEVSERLREPKACPDIWLLFAPLKKARNNFIIEKATELGVAKFLPILTERTTSKIRMDKLEAHIIEAAEQTERLDIPNFAAPEKLETLLANWDETRTLIFADEEGDAQTAAEILSRVKTPCAILIGPEGGFTAKERAYLRTQTYVVPMSLGPRILRADTAALATLSLWQALSGDW
ncbi:MAG: 16S rRNA (uracil(1498)-N(3))-methyltransferase [Robiginitomaculum sp.]|nr:MAG: 16S rRNA (uracil(1498)-N(3))-methyltransferase [Robiginitomaculum sp.]